MIIILCFDPPNVPGFEDPPWWPSCAYVAARPSRLTKKARGESLGDPYDLATKQKHHLFALQVGKIFWWRLEPEGVTVAFESVQYYIASFACSKSVHFIHGCMSCVLASFRTWQEQTRAENGQDAPQLDIILVMVHDHNSCQLGCPECRLLSPPSFSCCWNEFIFWRNVLIKGDSTHNVVVLYPVCFSYICPMVGKVDICWLVRNYHHHNAVWLKTKQKWTMIFRLMECSCLLLTCFAHDAILAQVLYVQASMSAHLGQL